jgi:hypothetical protein
LPEGGRVQYIDISPHRKGSAYFAVYRYLLGDYQPYIYSTEDYGKTWKRLTDGKNGIPNDWPTRVVREDPDREGLLYAGTEFGMFISFDNGGHWQPFQLNLPNVPVTDIKLHNNDLIVSTQGRSFWIIDNISSLHQLTPQTTTAGAYLFRPRDGYRTRVAPVNLGPSLDYYLPGNVAGPVTLEILDAKGAIVNSYNSETPVNTGRGGRGGAGAGGETAAPEDPDAAPARRLGPPPPRVTKSAGLNRVIWDVRNKEGVTVPPGKYQARLKVSDKTFTEGFNLLIDPRVAEDGVTLADLQEQYEHNMRMREMVTQVTQLVTRVREAQTKLRNASTPDNDMAAKVNAIAAKLLTDPIRYSKPGLQAHITYLAGMTANVDQKIGRDAVDRYNVLKKELDALRAEVDRVLGPAQTGSSDRDR